MGTELKETIQNLLLQFMHNMHEWEVMCNDIDKQSELSFEDKCKVPAIITYVR